MILEAKGLTKLFSGKKALDGVSLKVAKGDIFGIIGSSGAGKSTLLRCLSSLERDFEGGVKLSGEIFGEGESLRRQRKKLGMIFQHFHLLGSRTVEGNIALPLELQGIRGKERVKELVRLVGLEGKEKNPVTGLSGGEKQRVAIARALAGDPEILFCDEATSSLDPQSTSEILRLLSELNKKLSLTIVLITHEMDVIRKICGKVAVMSEGKIVESGTVLQVFGAPNQEITKGFLQNVSHTFDLSSVREEHLGTIFLTLHFTGETSGKPVLSSMITLLGIEVNILSGWIDRIGGVPLGSLTVGINGEQKEKAFAFLDSRGVRYEVLT